MNKIELRRLELCYKTNANFREDILHDENLLGAGSTEWLCPLRWLKSVLLIFCYCSSECHSAIDVYADFDTVARYLSYRIGNTTAKSLSAKVQTRRNLLTRRSNVSTSCRWRTLGSMTIFPKMHIGYSYLIRSAVLLLDLGYQDPDISMMMKSKKTFVRSMVSQYVP